MAAEVVHEQNVDLDEDGQGKGAHNVFSAPTPPNMPNATLQLPQAQGVDGRASRKKVQFLWHSLIFLLYILCKDEGTCRGGAPNWTDACDTVQRSCEGYPRGLGW